MTTKVMKLINENTGLMECQICGARHNAQIQPGGKYRRGSWQCPKGCKIEDSNEKGNRKK